MKRKYPDPGKKRSDRSNEKQDPYPTKEKVSEPTDKDQDPTEDNDRENHQKGKNWSSKREGRQTRSFYSARFYISVIF